jgi:hypothetical protein
VVFSLYAEAYCSLQLVHEAKHSTQGIPRAE